MEDIMSDWTGEKRDLGRGLMRYSEQIRKKGVNITKHMLLDRRHWKDGRRRRQRRIERRIERREERTPYQLQ